MKTQFQSTIFASCHSSAGRTRLVFLLTVLWLAMLASTKVSAAGFDSGIIDFDFNWNEIGYPAYGPGAAAIGSAGDLWNSVSIDYFAGQSPGPLNLYETDGSSTSVKWFNAVGGGIGATIGGIYGRLFDASAYMNSATITGLTPNQQYNLYLYSVYWDEVISVNGVDFTTYGIRYGNVNSLTAGSQYDVHTVTADPSGTLTFEAISAQFGTPYISSWQITPVPEPNTISLAGLVLLATTVFQLTRSRSQKRCS
jgi:hypothetical protein